MYVCSFKRDFSFIQNVYNSTVESVYYDGARTEIPDKTIPSRVLGCFPTHAQFFWSDKTIVGGCTDVILK